VERLAQASSLELISLQPPIGALPAQTTTGYTAVPITVSVHGTYANIANFLQRLRDSVVVSHDRLKVTNRLYIPTQIALSVVGSGQTLNASIGLSAFVYGTPPPPVAPPTGTTATTTTTP
jgi:Tfp pilus assembly protein PilO